MLNGFAHERMAGGGKVLTASCWLDFFSQNSHDTNG
jgi:hypothetical protein